MMIENGSPSDIELSREQRVIQAASETAVLLVRVGRDGSVMCSGDVITAGDEVRALGLLEKLKQAVGPICQQRRDALAQRIVPPPPGLRLS